jgi:hypothetical protein
MSAARPNFNHSEPIMYTPYKRTLTSADRALFEQALLGAAAFCGAVALLIVSAIAVGNGGGGNAQREVAAITTSSLPSPAP